MKFVLSIAASDSIGGAGIQADIKTITCLGAHALTAVTAVTAQNSLGITGIHGIPAHFIDEQLKAIFEDVPPDSVKVGMLHSASAIRAVAKAIRRYSPAWVVLDPVLRATTGKHLLESDALVPLKEELIPIVDVVTPNIHEAAILAGTHVTGPKDMQKTAEVLHGMGPAVVITGGHLEGRCLDMLFDGKSVRSFEDSKLKTPHTHGSGCIFSSALATFLAEGRDLESATGAAHRLTRSAIRKGYACGKGAGCVRTCLLNRRS